MKQIGSILLMFFLNISVFGQAQNNMDSLVNVLNVQQLKRKDKIEVYKAICEKYAESNQKQFYIYAKEGLELADKEGDLESISFFYNCLGKIYATKGSLDTARVYWDKLLDIALKMKNKSKEADAYIGIAILNNQQGKRDIALEYFLKALRIFDDTHDKDGQTTILCNIGSIHRTLGDPERAVYYLEKAKQIAEEINSKRQMFIYYELGGIYHKKAEFDKSLEYTLKALELSRSFNNRNLEIAALGGLGLIYCYARKDYAKAEDYAKESLNLAEEEMDKVRIYNALNDLSGIYRESGNYKQCEEIAYRAWQMDSTVTGNSGRIILYSIVYSNIQLGNKEKAIFFLNQFKKNAEQYNNKSFHDSLKEMEVKYETEKKEMQMASLEIEKQFYLWLGITGFLLAISLSVVMLQNLRNVKREKQLIATQSVMDGEMSERARLARDLHDRLSGNLSAVKIELSKAESLLKISDKLDDCIEEIRCVAHNLMPASLQYGVKMALEDFSAQFPNVHFHFFGKENRFEERAEFVIYCCANELVNNSLRHSGAKIINVQLVQDDKYVSLTVQDNGRGYDEKSAKKGLGLKNIYDRVASCNGKIDIVSSCNKGTETIIELEIK